MPKNQTIIVSTINMGAVPQGNYFNSKFVNIRDMVVSHNEEGEIYARVDRETHTLFINPMAWEDNDYMDDLVELLEDFPLSKGNFMEIRDGKLHKAYVVTEGVIREADITFTEKQRSLNMRKEILAYIKNKAQPKGEHAKPFKLFNESWSLRTLHYHIIGPATLRKDEALFNVVADADGDMQIFKAPYPQSFPGVMLNDHIMFQITMWGNGYVTDLRTLKQNRFNFVDLVDDEMSLNNSRIYIDKDSESILIPFEDVLYEIGVNGVIVILQHGFDFKHKKKELGWQTLLMTGGKTYESVSDHHETFGDDFSSIY